MMETKKKIISVVVGIGIITAFSAGVMASDLVQQITAEMDYSMKMKVNNQEWQPQEADGTMIRPITYNGRTYLPVRALSDKLGIAVDWDEQSRTVFIGEREWTPLESSQVDFTASDIGYTTDKDHLFVGDDFCQSGVVKNGDPSYSRDLMKVDGKFTKMKFTAYATGKDAVLKIYDMDTKQTYKTLDLKKDVKVPVEFDISGAKTLEFELLSHESYKNDYHVLMGDVQFK